MVLVVETGAGLSSANTFLSVDDADTYHTDRANTAWTGDTSTKEAALIRASQYLSDGFKWDGVRSQGRDQALAWPRAGCWDREQYAISNDEIPNEVKYATAEIALRELDSPGVMRPDYTPSERVRSERVGAVAVEYDLSRTDAGANVPIIHAVRDLVGSFLATGGGRLVGSSMR